MTKEEAQIRGNEKAQAIVTLCKQLEVTISAEQMITPEGLIKQVVYYTDNEKYDIDEEKEINKTKKVKNETKK